MKNINFNLGIALFLLVFLANFTAIQAQIPGNAGVRDSVYIWDDFSITGDILTDTNGSTGAGWDGVWTYTDGTDSGVDVLAEGLSVKAGGFGIDRDLINSIPLGTSEFFLSFVVNKSETGHFRIAGNRADGIERYAVGVNADGALRANIANTIVTSDAGVIANNSTYLVVAKWMYSGNGLMNIAVIPASEIIPADEPVAGEWELEGVGGQTGVPIDYFRLDFTSGDVSIYDFKVGDTWNSVVDSTVLITPTDIEAMAISSASMMLSWSENSFKEEGYKIYLDGNEIATLGVDVKEYEVTGLTDGNTYTFGVSAYAGSEESGQGQLESIFELDVTPPTVLEVSPENNATDVDETSDIVIEFSEIMNTSNVEGAITVTPALVNAQYTWEGATTLTINSDDMENSTQYIITIGTGATDLSGNGLETEYTTTFTTIEKDITPPTIVGSTPADNETDVLMTSNIIIAFSEPIVQSSIEGEITVAPALTNMEMSWLSDTLVKISGDDYLALSTNYTVTVGTGVMDLKGNSMAAEETITFTTSASQLIAYDGFSVPDGLLTNSNGNTGQGWDEDWRYITSGFVGGDLYTINEYMSGSDVGHIIRALNHSISISNDDFYMSYLAYRTADGSFDVLGGDEGADARYRAGVGVSAEGALRFRKTTGAVETSTTSGQFEAGTTYLVVSKYTAQESAKVKIFKAGDQVVEPGDGDWDFEVTQGNTGVVFDRLGLLFRSTAANIDEVKVGNSWDEVANTAITDLSEFPLIPPSALHFEGNSTTSAELVWDDNSLVEEGFKIYVNETEVGTVGENETYFEVPDLTEGETYIIKVSSYKGSKEQFSDTIMVTFEFDAENYVNTKIKIGKTPTAPVIDGTVDDVWNVNAAKNPIKRYNPTSDEAPEDEADYQGFWRAMWDNNSLYLLFEITDDILVLADESGTGIGQRDGFDLPMAKGSDGVWTMNRLNLITTTGSDTTIYFHEGMAAIKNAEKAFTITEDGYIIELSVVLRDFDDAIGLFPEGYQFNIDVRYNDNDGGESREAQYTWTDKNKDDWTWDNFNSLGSVTLVDAVDIDNEAPTVTATSPGDGATGVVLNSDIVINFSEAMNHSSVAGAVHVEPELTNVTFTWDGDAELTISADEMSPTMEYKVTVGTGAMDMSGNAMEAVYSFSFTTDTKTGVGQVQIQKIKVYTSQFGSLLHIDHYDGPAVIIDITGRHVLNIENSMNPVNISHLNNGIYIVRTKEKGSVKFVK